MITIHHVVCEECDERLPCDSAEEAERKAASHNDDQGHDAYAASREVETTRVEPKGGGDDV